jgi:uncharacterized membrane protein
MTKGGMFMKYAKDFRRDAREALKGRWIIAVVAGLIASLLGAATENAPEINFNAGSSNGETTFNILPFINGMSPHVKALLVGGVTYIFIIALIMAVLYFVLGGVVEIGYAKFNMNIADRKIAGIENVFGYFPIWKSAAALKLLKTLYIFLWSLLFIIPGIVAAYSYAMASYIMAENPDMTAGEAISASKQMMMGNRGRLFCMLLSFIGWDILSAITLGIGSLWLTPYKQAATAAFYREVSGTQVSGEEYAEQ